MLSNRLDLEQIHENQDPTFFTGKGTAIDIARRFVSDIGDRVRNVGKFIPIEEST
jgi:hypothetical protein